MLTLPTAATRLRRELALAEKTSDQLLLQISAVQATIVIARNDTDVAVHTGQEAMLRVQRAMSQALAAQTDLFRAHESLAKVGRETMGGEEEYTPATGLVDGELGAPTFEIAA
jgi:hypothetical protein